jgi:hypothetical protein
VDVRLLRDEGIFRAAGEQRFELAAEVLWGTPNKSFGTTYIGPMPQEVAAEPVCSQHIYLGDSDDEG